jgi:probable HAF family extracellular repeat protein
MPGGTRETPAYTVQYFDGLGGSNSRGNSINNDGWVAGYSNLGTSPHRHATLWIDGAPTDLGTLGNPATPKNSNVVWPVKNTRGLIVGISQTDSPDPWGENWSCSAFFVPATSGGYRCIGFAWENGVMRPLPTLGGTHGFAAAANNVGQIVGWAENAVRDKTCTPPQVFQFRAVVWGPHGNHVDELPVPPGDSSSAATALNDRGQIVGISGACDDAIGSATAAHPVLWDNGTVEVLPTLGGAEWNTPTAINERGDVAGFGDHAGDLVTEAFFWNRAGGLKPLGFLNGDHVLSEAFGMNNKGQVVGLSCSDTECHAFLWQDGSMLDLNALVAPDDNVVLTHAMDINDQGVVTGRAFIKSTGKLVTYVATPAEPSAPLARRAQRPSARVTLSAAVMREILHPLGPGRSRFEPTAR